MTTSTPSISDEIERLESEIWKLNSSLDKDHIARPELFLAQAHLIKALQLLRTPALCGPSSAGIQEGEGN